MKQFVAIFVTTLERTARFKVLLGVFQNMFIYIIAIHAAISKFFHTKLIVSKNSEN